MHDFKHFYWIGHDVIFGSRSRSALEYWFSNSFTAFCFLWIFWYWWPAGRVCISRGFKGPRETPRSKPNIFTGLLFTRVGREMQASDWGKPQVEDKLVFMITCTVLWRLESSVVVEFSLPVSFQVDLSWPAVAEKCVSGDGHSYRHLFRPVKLSRDLDTAQGLLMNSFYWSVDKTAVNYRRAGV